MIDAWSMMGHFTPPFSGDTEYVSKKESGTSRWSDIYADTFFATHIKGARMSRTSSP